MPFIEQMGTFPGGSRKEFWWEREWRRVGHYALPDRVIGLCPESEIDDFRRSTANRVTEYAFIDPRWGLERIIAHLAGFDEADVEIL
jgi:hypothetical protein